MANENIIILKQAEKLINDLNDELYVDNTLPPFQSGVGKHIRHVLDFYLAFLAFEDERINYDGRARSTLVETNRNHAVETIKRIIQGLASIHDGKRQVMCKNDDGGHRQPDHAFSLSSIGRELQFLASHAVHHFAIIAMILTQLGYPPPKDFGVATSTLTHWQKIGYPDHA